MYIYIYIIIIIIIIIILPMRIAISWGSLHVKTPMTGIMLMVIPSWPLVFHPQKHMILTVTYPILAYFLQVIHVVG